MAAGVADLRQRVVFREDGDLRAAASAAARGEGGRNAERRIFDLKARIFQHTDDFFAGLKLFSRNLGARGKAVAHGRHRGGVYRDIFIKFRYHLPKLHNVSLPLYAISPAVIIQPRRFGG